MNYKQKHKSQRSKQHELKLKKIINKWTNLRVLVNNKFYYQLILTFEFIFVKKTDWLIA